MLTHFLVSGLIHAPLCCHRVYKVQWMHCGGSPTHWTCGRMIIDCAADLSDQIEWIWIERVILPNRRNMWSYLHSSISFRVSCLQEAVHRPPPVQQEQSHSSEGVRGREESQDTLLITGSIQRDEAHTGNIYGDLRRDTTSQIRYLHRGLY